MFAAKPKSAVLFDDSCCGHCASTIDVKRGFCRDCRTYSFRDMDQPLGNFNFKRTASLKEVGYRYCTDNCSSKMKPLSDFDDGKHKCRKCLTNRKRRRQKSTLSTRREEGRAAKEPAFVDLPRDGARFSGSVAWSFFEEIWDI